MRYLLDTNIVSEPRKAKPHGGVMAWFAAHQGFGLAIPSVVLFEVQMGAERLRKKDAFRAEQFDRHCSEIARAFTILPLDEAAARETARMLGGLQMDMLVDAMIAAIARVHRLTVATRNMSHFERFDVPLVNPFDYRQ